MLQNYLLTLAHNGHHNYALLAQSARCTWERCSVPFCPKIECEILDIRVQLRRQVQKGLKDMPRADCSKLSSVCSVRLNQRVSALAVGIGSFITEAHLPQIVSHTPIRESKHRCATYPYWLAEKEHIAFFIPCIGVQLRFQILSNIARSQFL